jgi:hypothetical protein
MDSEGYDGAIHVVLEVALISVKPLDLTAFG